MPLPRSKSDRVAFVACTSVAIAVIAGMWIWNVRALVNQGVSGARQVLSDVSATASTVKEQSAPDPVVAASIKAGIHAALGAAAEKKAAEDAEEQAAVDAVAQMMSEKLTADEATEGTDPDETPDEEAVNN